MNIQTYLQLLDIHLDEHPFAHREDGPPPSLLPTLSSNFPHTDQVDNVSLTPSYQLLTDLQERHMHTIPFENLSVVWQEPIVLDEKMLYEKIVASETVCRNNRISYRGGFCYELNGLFSWLLRQLGFRVDRVAARVYHAGTQTYGHPFDHLTLIAHFDTKLATNTPQDDLHDEKKTIHGPRSYVHERYLVDVGFGDSVRSPLKLPDIDNLATSAGLCGPEVEDVSGRYRLRYVEELDTAYSGETLIYEKFVGSDKQKSSEQKSSEQKSSEQKSNLHENNGWQPRYMLRTNPHELVDYVEGCHYHQTSPESTFTQRTVCTKATPDGRMTLTAEHFTVTRNGNKERTEIGSPEEFAVLLQQHFGIRRGAKANQS